MLFTSWAFLLFLAVLFLSYYLIPKKLQWVLLLVANLVFYACAGLGGLVFICLTICSTYAATRLIARTRERRQAAFKACSATLSREEKKGYKNKTKHMTRTWLVLCLAFNFGILAVLKYAGFFVSIFSREGALTFSSLILPMGISFYTFQTMGYLIDIHRDKYPVQKNICKLALFTSFFPLLVQGPITRYDALSRTLYGPHTFDAKQVTLGLWRMLLGYFKKVVIADRILVAVTALIADPQTYDGVYALLGMAFYAIQIYADFTGGIDITIGIAQVLGITVEENFIRPYFSKNIAEYWRRWHISLGTWFREYLFYPLSTSKPLLNLSKKARKALGNGFGKRLPVYVSTIILWFITGLWHGAAWNFIVWGFGNGVIIILSQELSPLYEKFHSRFPGLKQKWGYRLFEIARTVFILSALRMLDCYRNVATTLRQFFSIFTAGNYGTLSGEALLGLGLSAADYILLAVGVVLLTLYSLLGRKGCVREMLYEKPLALRYAVTGVVLMAILLFGAYGIGYDASQFIYNQF